MNFERPHISEVLNACFQEARFGTCRGTYSLFLFLVQAESLQTKKSPA